MCNSAPGWLHSKRWNVWRPARRRRETPWRLSTREIVDAMAPGDRLQPHRPPVRARPRIEDALLLDRAQRPRTRIRDRPTRPTPLARPRCSGLANNQRSRALVTVVGEHPMIPRDRTRLLAREHARNHLTLRARSEAASTVRHVRPPSEACSRGDHSLRRRPDDPLNRPLSPQARQLVQSVVAAARAHNGRPARPPRRRPRRSRPPRRRPRRAPGSARRRGQPAARGPSRRAVPSTRAHSPTTHSRPTVTAPASTQRSPSTAPAPTVSSPPRASSRAPSPSAALVAQHRGAPARGAHSTPRPSRTPAPSWTRGRRRARQARIPTRAAARPHRRRPSPSPEI